ncbi:MAG: MiaB/RimO family radical SAM methylthiotransferase [Synergistes sp.]|nr:MiaB/RimO family radical SAM methylthiotransferase [Synergistes sp.]
MCKPELLKDKRFAVEVEGCRTNQYEGEAIAAAFESCGAVQCSEAPDIAIIVGCTITAAADRKCRKMIRHTRRSNPNAVIIVCGCYAQNMTEAECATLGADIAVGNRMKEKLPQMAEQFLKERKTICAVNENILHDSHWDALSLDRPRLHTRAFLKIQDGCSQYCSYCIVPSVRGLPVSRALDEAVNEAKRITEAGCAEIVLTGIHIGLYENLPLLVEKISALPKIRRLRFGSIEPLAVSDRLLGVLADSPVFCCHLHIPLQSGDTSVLSDMKRGYSARDFARITENARARLGDTLHISTDLMVGFPTEDKISFEKSLKFVKECSFGKVHVFPYSPRKGTEAAKLSQIPQQEMNERSSEALTLAAALHEKFCSRWIGRECEMLTEENKNGTIKGLTRNYIRITAHGTSEVGEDAFIIPVSYKNEGLSAP